MCPTGRVPRCKVFFSSRGLWRRKSTLGKWRQTPPASTESQPHPMPNVGTEVGTLRKNLINMLIYIRFMAERVSARSVDVWPPLAVSSGSVP